MENTSSPTGSLPLNGNTEGEIRELADHNSPALGSIYHGNFGCVSPHTTSQPLFENPFRRPVHGYANGYTGDTFYPLVDQETRPSQTYHYSRDLDSYEYPSLPETSQASTCLPERPWSNVSDEYKSLQRQDAIYACPQHPTSGIDLSVASDEKNSPGHSLRRRNARVVKAAARKGRERPKAPKEAGKLLKPLSELAKEHLHVPVADIDAYVRRSPEERQQEVQQCKIPGKIKRPMNAFMLYRKAYQNLAKIFCNQNNHQLVSQVCGDGWPLEPDVVRSQYNTWAKIERENHQRAHPGYKFTPAKPKRKKGGDGSDGEDGDDGGWSCGRNNTRKRIKVTSAQAAIPSPTDGMGGLRHNFSAESIQTRTYLRDLPLVDSNIRNKVEFDISYHEESLLSPLRQASMVDDYFYQPSFHHCTSQPGGAADLFMRETPLPTMNVEYGQRSGPDIAYFGNFPSMGSSPAFNGRMSQALHPYDDVLGHISLNEEYHSKWDPDLNHIDHQSDDAPLASPELVLDPHLRTLKGEDKDWHVQELKEETQWIISNETD